MRRGQPRRQLVLVRDPGRRETTVPLVVDAPAASEPFQAAFRAVTAAPDCVTVAPQDWLTTWPLPKLNVAVQVDDDAVVPL